MADLREARQLGQLQPARKRQGAEHSELRGQERGLEHFDIDPARRRSSYFEQRIT